MDLIWILIAAYNLLGIGIATYSTQQYISGWLIPAASLGWYLFCFGLWYYEVVPLWAFALLTVFGQFIGPLGGKLLLRLRMGRRYEAWNYTFEAYEYFHRSVGVCRKSQENKEVIANLLLEATLWHLLMRQNNSCLRRTYRTSDEGAAQAQAKITELGLRDAWCQVESDQLLNLCSTYYNRVNNAREQNGYDSFSVRKP